MSPSAMPKPSTLVVKPIEHAHDKLCNFGATISGVDLNDISDEDVQAIKNAAHKYRLVVIKSQNGLDPIKHWEFVTRLDPGAKQVHSHGTAKDFTKHGGVIA